MTDYRLFAEIPDNTYDVVLADCPWWYSGSPNKQGAAGKHYDLMEDTDIKALPVRSLATKRALCFMWATCPRLDLAVAAMTAWGFHFRGVAFVWVKTRKNGGIIHGQGVRPTVVKPTTEMVLVGATTKTGRPIPLQSEAMGQVLWDEGPDVILAPRGGHSVKPEEVRTRIVHLFGHDIRYLELFARGPEVAGWDRFGNEI